MAMLQQRLPNIGCQNVLTCTKIPCFTSSLDAVPCLPLLVRVNGKKKAASTPRSSNAISISGTGGRRSRESCLVVAASASDVAPSPASGAVSVSDVLWPSAGAFLAMAVLGRMDQMMASKGISLTIAPLGAVSAVLFTAPNSPAAKKYNMFVAQVGCAALGVLAFSLFGPGWLARGTALAACIAFMIITGASHPPAASLPLLFIDGAKFHKLQFWYALFPGAAGCIVLCLIQEVVVYLKNNCRF